MKVNDFVKVKNIDGVAGLGIVMEVTKNSFKSENGEDIALVVLSEVTEDFGVDEFKLDEVTVLSDEEVKDMLNEVAENQEYYAYFIIQLNDIPNLSEFHIDESEYVKGVRAELEI